MHSACATIVQRICASDSNKMTLQSYYNILRKACTLFLAEGGINWPHEHFGTMQYWAYHDWDYRDGYLKFVFDPLRSTDTNVLIVNSLEPARDRGSGSLLPQGRIQARSSIETLPTEIMDQIVNCLPIGAIHSLRLASSSIVHQVPLDQRFFRDRLFRGDLLPHIWDLDQAWCFTSGQHTRGSIADASKIEHGDWRGLARFLSDIPGLLSKLPEDSGLPLGLWNRLRTWQSVVDAEKWLDKDQ